jgi:hypothetical protein
MPPGDPLLEQVRPDAGAPAAQFEVGTGLPRESEVRPAPLLKRGAVGAHALTGNPADGEE